MRKQETYEYKYYDYSVDKWKKGSKKFDIYEPSEFKLIHSYSETWVYFEFEEDLGNYQRLPHYLRTVRRLVGDIPHWEYEDDWSGATIWSTLNKSETKHVAILEEFYKRYIDETDNSR